MNLTRPAAAAMPAALLLCASAAHAETTTNQSARSSAVIEEVVVTARKRAEVAQDIPLAITALAEELTRPTVRDLTDLNGFAPNVRFDRDQGRNNGASISIRGISPTRTDDNSFDPPIGVMIDGIYLGTLGGQLLENFDVERVEILRGPQGTLFGRNTVGGVVNVVRSRPTGELGARVKLTTGRHDRLEARAVLNAPVIPERLAAKGFFTSIENDGFMFNETIGERLPEKDYQNYGLTLLATPAERFEALFTVERFEDDSDIGAFNTNFNLAPGVAPPPDDPTRETDLSAGLLACTVYGAPCRDSLEVPDTAETNFANPAHTRVDAYTLDMRLELTDTLSLVSVTGYRDVVEDRKVDFDGSAADFITIERDNDYDQLSQELRLEGTFSDVSFVTGLYYWESEFTQDWITGGTFWSDLVPPLVGDGVTPNPVLAACIGPGLGALRCDAGAPAAGLGPNFVQVLYETQETTSFAAFGQVEWEFVEDWTLTAGLRWTDERKDFRAGQAYLAPLDRARERNFPGFADLDNDWQEFSPKVGLSHEFSEDILFYFTYAEGFHSGGFFGVNQNISDFERDQYDPEFANTYELGMKTQWFDDRLLFNLTLFRNDFEDKQEQSLQVDPSTSTVATVFDNVAEAIYQGVEVELQWAANEYLRFFTAVGYLDAEFDEFETDITPNDNIDNIVDASFLEPRNAPEYTVGIGGTLTYPLGDGLLEVHTKYDWIDDVETNLLNQEIAHLDARENLNASIGYHYRERYSVTLFGRNLTDEQYETISLVQPLFAAGTVNEGWTWGLELEARLGPR